MAELNMVGSKRSSENWTKEHLTADEKKLLEWHGEGFDTRCHIVNPRTGECIRQQSYRLVIDKGTGESHYIRNGKRYTDSGVCLDDPKPTPDHKKVK